MKLGAGQTTNVVATVKASKKALPGDYVTKMTVKTPEVNATTDFSYFRKNSDDMGLGWCSDHCFGIGRRLLSVPQIWKEVSHGSTSY